MDVRELNTERATQLLGHGRSRALCANFPPRQNMQQTPLRQHISSITVDRPCTILASSGLCISGRPDLAWSVSLCRPHDGRKSGWYCIMPVVSRAFLRHRSPNLHQYIVRRAYREHNISMTSAPSSGPKDLALVRHEHLHDRHAT